MPGGGGGASGAAGGGNGPAAGGSGANAGGQPAAGSSGSGPGGNASGGGPGLQLPVGGPLYHVSCLLALGGGDPANAIRFAGKILVIPGGQRFVYLQPLSPTADTLDDTVGPVSTGQSDGAASDGDPVRFGEVTIPGEANPLSASTLVVEDARLRLVLAGPGGIACADLDGKLTTPFPLELGDPATADTCLFDPVQTEETKVARVDAAARFAPCKAP